MKRLPWLAPVLATLAACAGQAAAAPPAIPDRLPAIAAMLVSMETGETPDSLMRAFQLHMAAHQFSAALTTLDRLESAYGSGEPRRIPSVIPWRIYTRARIYEEDGQPAHEALARAFQEIYGALDDRQAAKVLPWYDGDLAPSASAIQAAEAACSGTALDACPQAAELIALHQAAQAVAAFVPASQPMLRADQGRRFTVEEHVAIPTPDGAWLSAILVRPRVPSERRVTALLNFTIYANDEWSLDDAVSIAARGYAGIVAYTRGKAGSPGPVQPYMHDGEDASTVIDWIARQPWSDGRVGMFSGSYNGFTQWAAAKRHPAALKAIATNATNAPGIDTPMQGNVFQSFMYPWPFYTTDIPGLDDSVYGDHARWDRLERAWYVEGAPYRDLARIDGTPNPVFDEWLDHPAYDAYWQRLIPYREEFAQIDIPVFVETGYYDGGMVGALYYFEQHLKYRPRANDRMLIGPYHHIAMQTGVLPRIGGEAVDRVGLVDLQDLRLDWFDHVFRGGALPALLAGRVNFEVMGADTWRHAATVESMAPHRLRLYLSGGRPGTPPLLAAMPGHRLPPDLRVDLADRRDVDGQPPRGTPDTRNALVFATPPLREPLEVDGRFVARFGLSVNKRDFDLAVDLYELTADGRYLPLSSYLGRASFMKDRTHRSLLHPNRPCVLDFRSQTVTSRRLAAGSRLIAVVGIPKSPAVQINYGTGKDVSDESIADAGVPIVIHWSAHSHLDLGVMTMARFAE